jgi:uncharacterized protein (DUF4415 family)
MRKAKALQEFVPGRGYTKKDWDDVSDNPEWTAEDFAKGKSFAEVFPEMAAKIRRGRGPNKAPTKQLISLRLSSAVVNHFKDTGPGWQKRIDETLRKAAGIAKATVASGKDGGVTASRGTRKVSRGKIDTPAPKKRQA